MKYNRSYRKNLCLDIAALEGARNGRLRYEFNGINIWPILRADLCKSVEDEVIASGRILANLQPALSRFQQHINDEQGSISNEYFPRLIQDFSWGPKSGPRLLFHTRTLRHQPSGAGESVCGQIDFLYRLLEQNFECIKIEQLSNQAQSLRPRFVEPYYFEPPIAHDLRKCVSLLSTDCYWPEENIVLDKYDTLFEDLGVAEKAPEFSGLRTRLSLMHAYAHIFESILRHLNPAAIFTELYYNSEVWGLLLAAKRLGIPTVEVQHGLVGRYQWIMTHWSSIPDFGFDLLPDYFWCFDEETAENLFDSNKATSSLYPIVGGIPKLTYWAKQKTNAIKPEYQQYLTDLENEEFVVLIALNYHTHAPENVLFAIEQLPKNWRWLIRLHPMSVPAQELIEQAYRKHGLENVEFHFATKVPAYDLLSAVDHLVTGYSTLATEALPFGIGVTLSDPIGAELYPQFIADGRMSVGVSGDALVSILKAAALRRQTVKKTRCKPNVVDYSAGALDELFNNVQRRSYEIKKRKERLEKSSFFQNSPIDRIKKISEALSKEQAEQAISNVASLGAVEQGLHSESEAPICKMEANKEQPSHIVDGLSILPILLKSASFIGNKGELPGESLKRFTKPYLRKFEKRLAAEIGDSHRFIKSNDADLLFYDLSVHSELDKNFKYEQGCLFFVSRTNQYRSVDKEQFECSLDPLIRDLSLTFNTVKSEIYSAKSMRTARRKLPTKFIRTPWGGSAEVFKQEYLDLFQQCPKQQIIDALDAVENAQEVGYDNDQVDQLSFDVALSSAYIRVFQSAISIEQPSAVFIDDANTWENWGATVAAKNFGIPVVQVMPMRLAQCIDIATARYRRVDGEDGFLPDYYWCSYEQNELEYGSIDSFLNYIVAVDRNGAPYIINKPNGSYSPCLSAEERSYRKFIQRADRVVVVALANDCRPPKSLLKAIKNLPQTWLWLIQAPRSGLHGIDIVAAQFNKAGIVNFEVQFASRLPLVELASQADAFVAIKGSIEHELSAAEIDHLLLDTSQNSSEEVIKESLLNNTVNISRRKKAMAGTPVGALNAIRSDWHERSCVGDHNSDESKFDAYIKKLPSMHVLWRHHYIQKDLRASEFSLIPQGAGVSAHEKCNQTYLTIDLGEFDAQSTVHCLGSRRSLIIAIKIMVWIFRRLLSPRRRLLNAFRRIKTLFSGKAGASANTADQERFNSKNITSFVEETADKETKPAQAPIELHENNALPIVERLGGWRSLKVASGLAILAVGRKVSPRRRLLNAYQQIKKLFLGETYAFGGSTTMPVVVDLALIHSDQELFSFIYEVDRLRRAGRHTHCQLIAFYECSNINMMDTWSVYSRIVPIFSGLLPHFNSIQMISDQSESAHLLDAADREHVYYWRKRDQENALPPGKLIPTLLYDDCKPIIVDEESTRYARQWRNRICGNRILVAVSYGDNIGALSDEVVETLNDTIRLFQGNNIEVVILPSVDDGFNFICKRIAHAPIFEECRYNLQLRAALFEAADQNILIGDGVNALAALNANTSWYYLQPDLVKFGRHSKANGENIVFEEIPPPEDLLNLITDRFPRFSVEQAAAE